MGRRIRAAQERREMRLANARAEKAMRDELEALRAVRERSARARQDEAQNGGGK